MSRSYQAPVQTGTDGEARWPRSFGQFGERVFEIIEAEPDRLREVAGVGTVRAKRIIKSQGSEYPVVVIPLTTQHYTMLARNLLYTGVTRGKQLVVLIGQRKALAIAVKNGASRQRCSLLQVRLKDTFRTQA